MPEARCSTTSTPSPAGGDSTSSTPPATSSPSGRSAAAAPRKATDSSEADGLLQASADVEDLVAADCAGAGDALAQHVRQRAARDHRRPACRAPCRARSSDRAGHRRAARRSRRRSAPGGAGDDPHPREQVGDRGARDTVPGEFAPADAHRPAEVFRQDGVQPDRASTMWSSLSSGPAAPGAATSCHTV